MNLNSHWIIYLIDWKNLKGRVNKVKEKKWLKIVRIDVINIGNIKKINQLRFENILILVINNFYFIIFLLI
jgi:hypothetical protein